MTRQLDVRSRILKQRGVELAKHTRKPRTADDLPAPYPKTRAMKYLELKFGKRLEELILVGNIYDLEKKLGVDATTISKWRKLVNETRDKIFWSNFGGNNESLKQSPPSPSPTAP